ncbi:DUF6011 domain-containing protein [Tsukamurella spumae]|uniref:Uncharacterized protein n=1 Tax=Tsukamurella spumae TaxID=44753 RepID=A0A846WX97_9ACTN|nr:DUF6011 domain-containing protein [Tsukamurella spumae]NKY17521.1 hypothetical protein [Tsukamurella spumae]
MSEDDGDLSAGRIAGQEHGVFEAYGAGWVLVPLCSKCGAPLTARESKVRGMGPVCARRSA